ncbi:histone H1A-like [Hydra vulgaris]|uniref:Histone H1A-like n=1 Tax=Hydra vulgaris TaxID=6087 RepID=A0ABM4DAM1_HYDVU
MSTIKNNTDLDDVFKDNEVNVTYVKPINAASQIANAAGKSTKQANPKTYFDMVLEAIEKLQGRNGVSRSKITNFIVREFKIADVSTVYVTKALRSALEKNIIGNTTGNGANGSFKLTKEQNDIRKKIGKDRNVKKDKPVNNNKIKKLEYKVESDDESKTEKSKIPQKLSKKKNTSKKVLHSKDDLELAKSQKTDDKKVSTAKGKENGKVKESKAQKNNKAKKNLEKSFSTGDIKVAKETVYDFPEADGEIKPKKLKDLAVTSRKPKKK